MNRKADPSLADRFRGCLLGLAVGDALGTTLEFKEPGSFEPINDMVGGGPFRLEAGQWTDDTSMALCLADSLLAQGASDAHDQMQRYLRWSREGYRSSTGSCFDIGNTISSALSRYEATGEPFSGSTDEFSAGNGSLMRLAPVPMFFFDEPDRAIREAGTSSRTTHGARAAIDACRYFAGVLVGALHGLPRDEVLSAGFHPSKGRWKSGELAPEIEEVAHGSFKRKEPPEIAGTGYVVRSLEAALWAFCRANDFREGCLMAVNLGNDADTTGAIYGQIAGAHWGANDIPEPWTDRITMREEILALADRLLRSAKSE